MMHLLWMDPYHPDGRPRASRFKKNFSQNKKERTRSRRKERKKSQTEREEIVPSPALLRTARSSRAIPSVYPTSFFLILCVFWQTTPIFFFFMRKRKRSTRDENSRAEQESSWQARKIEKKEREEEGPRALENFSFPLSSSSSSHHRCLFLSLSREREKNDREDARIAEKKKRERDFLLSPVSSREGCRHSQNDEQKKEEEESIIFFFRSRKIELEHKELTNTKIVSRRKWEKEDGGKMIKAFIVVNNHAMVRLCRFYEQLVRVFSSFPLRWKKTLFFCSLRSLFDDEREFFLHKHREKATDTRARMYTCKTLMNPPLPLWNQTGCR